jgi:hypothetical protein
MPGYNKNNGLKVCEFTSILVYQSLLATLVFHK